YLFSIHQINSTIRNGNMPTKPNNASRLSPKALVERRFCRGSTRPEVRTRTCPRGRGSRGKKVFRSMACFLDCGALCRHYWADWRDGHIGFLRLSTTRIDADRHRNRQQRIYFDPPTPTHYPGRYCGKR